MARARFNVLVLPYRLRGGRHEFAVFHRSHGEMWQFIAGGGENDETPLAAARREAEEEGGIVERSRWTQLDSTASIPRTAFPGAPWPDSVFVVPEHCFAVEVGDDALHLSHGHDQCAWFDYETARARLTWDSNKVALWELRERLEKMSDPALRPALE
jgi:dATP pyrophosphohydrolase